MDDLRISDMMEMQRALWTLHKDAWSPIEPAYGKDFILYMIEEIGECVAILKKKGGDAVVSDPAVRAHFLEEASDVLMYFTDMLLHYYVTPEEISRAYTEKHSRNMGRDLSEEYRERYED